MSQRGDRRAALGSVVAAVICAAAVGPVATPAAAYVDPTARATLAGLDGVYVLIEPVASEAERDGLFKTTVQTDVELKLRQAGIRVLTVDELKAARRKPLLVVRVNAMKSNDGLSYAVSINTHLAQRVVVATSKPEAVMAITWTTPELILTVGSAKIGEVRQEIRDQVDVFINAYLAVNR